MISLFKDRLSEIHISSVNTQSVHESLTLDALMSFRKLKEYLPTNAPLIIESPIMAENIEHEMDLATCIITHSDNNYFNEIQASLLEF